MRKTIIHFCRAFFCKINVVGNFELSAFLFSSSASMELINREILSENLFKIVLTDVFNQKARNIRVKLLLSPSWCWSNQKMADAAGWLVEEVTV